MTKYLVLVLLNLCLVSRALSLNPTLSAAESAVGISLSAINNISCYGLQDGSASFVIVDALSVNSYDYTVVTNSNVVASGSSSGILDLAFTVNNLAASDYTLSITFHQLLLGDETKTIEFTITEPAQLDLMLDLTHITCVFPTGSIEILSTGGTGATSLNIIGGLLNLTNAPNLIADLSAGNYTITAIDQNSCSVESTVTIQESTQDPTVQISGDLSLGCEGITTLSASTSLGVSIAWSTTGGNIIGSVTGSSIQVNQPGTYICTVIDILNGCTSVDMVEVIANVQLPTVTINGQLTLGCTGSITLSASTSPGVTVSWSTIGGNIIGSISGTSIQADQPGTYICTVIDILNGCTSSDMVEVIANVQLPTVTINGQLTLGCTGSVTLSASTSPSVTLLWSTIGGNIIGSVTGSSIQVDQPGTYLCTVTDILNGCTSAEMVEVVANVQLPTVTITGQLSLGCSGAVTLSASTSSGVTVSWSTIGGHIIGSVTGSSIQVDEPGTYLCTVTDILNGCTSTEMVEVVANVQLPAIDITGDLNLGCNSSINLSVSTTSGVTITWETPNGNILGPVTGSSIAVSEPGTYIAKGVSLSTGCAASDTVVVEVGLDLPSINLGVDKILGCNPSVIISATTNAASVIWSSIGGHILGSLTGTEIEVDEVGIYIAEVFDPISGCTASDTVEVIEGTDGLGLDLGADITVRCLSVLDIVAINPGNLTLNWSTIGGNIIGLPNNNTIQIDQPGIYVASSLHLATGCLFSDTIKVTAEITIDAPQLADTFFLNCEGSTTVSIEQELGANLEIAWITLEGSLTIDEEGTSALITAPGVYTMIATDLITGCAASDTFIVLPPQLFLLDVDVYEPACAGDSTGSIAISVSGGVGPYNYNWSDGSQTPELINRPAGDYQVTVADALDCSELFSITISEPDKLRLEILKEKVTDSTTLVKIIPHGGVTPYSFLWNTGDTLSQKVLGFGQYDITVTDANDCWISDTLELVDEREDECNLVIDLQITETSASNPGTVTASAIGGTAPYTYHWSTGETGQSITTIPGNYVLTVTDAQQCTLTIPFTILDNGPDTCDLTVNVQYKTLNDSITMLTVTPTTGTAPFSYSWSNGDTTSSISIGPGRYSALVTDSSGCTASFSFDLNDEDDPGDNDDCDLALGIIITNANTDEKGTASIIISGGTEPYQILWSDGSTGFSINNLDPGQYTVKIVDAKGCEISAIFIIRDIPGGPTDFCTAEDVIVESCRSLVFFSQPEVQSEMSYTVQQVSGLASGSVFPLGITRVAFLIKYENGACDFCEFDVVVDGEPNFEIIPPSCTGASDGEIRVQLSDTSADHCLYWDDPNKQSGPVAMGLGAGDYHVYGHSSQGCIINSAIQLSEPAPLKLMEGVIMNSMSDIKNGQIQVTMQGGTYPYAFEWSGPDDFSSELEDLYNVGAGTYNVKITDARGCVMALDDMVVEEDLASGVSSEVLAQITKVYPNPTAGYLAIKFDFDQRQRVIIGIYNNVGQLVQEEHFEDVMNNTVKLQLDQYSAGIHFINIRTKDAVLVRKITFL